MLQVRYVFVVARHQFRGDANIVRKVADQMEPDILGVEQSHGEINEILYEERQEAETLARIGDESEHRRLKTWVRSPQFISLTGDPYDHAIEVLRADRKLPRYFLERYSPAQLDWTDSLKKEADEAARQKDQALAAGNIEAALAAQRRELEKTARYDSYRDNHMVTNLRPESLVRDVTKRFPAIKEGFTICPIVGDRHLPVAEKMEAEGFPVEIFTQHKPHLLWHYDSAVLMARRGEPIPESMLIQSMFGTAIDRVLISKLEPICEASSEMILFYRLLAERISIEDMVAFLKRARTLENLLKKCEINIPKNRARLLRALRQQWPNLAIA